MPKHGKDEMGLANVETVKPHKKNPSIAGAARCSVQVRWIAHCEEIAVAIDAYC